MATWTQSWNTRTSGPMWTWILVVCTAAGAVAGQEVFQVTDCLGGLSVLRCEEGMQVVVSDVRLTPDVTSSRCQTTLRCDRDEVTRHLMTSCHGHPTCVVDFNDVICEASTPRYMEKTVIYACVPDDAVINVCDSSVIRDAEFGVVLSPGFPSPYSPNLYCATTLTYSSMVSLALTVLYQDLGVSGKPCPDRLELGFHRLSEGQTFSTIFPLCSDSTTKSFQPVNVSSLSLTFYTNGVMAHPGFKLYFTASLFSPEKTSSKTTITSTTPSIITSQQPPSSITTSTISTDGEFNGATTNDTGQGMSGMLLAAVIIPGAILVISIIAVIIVFARRKKKSEDEAAYDNSPFGYVTGTSSAGPSGHRHVREVGEVTQPPYSAHAPPPRPQLSDSELESDVESNNTARKERNVKWLGMGENSD